MLNAESHVDRASTTPPETGLRDDSERNATRDQIDAFESDQPITTRAELWSYFFYFNGDNGVGPISYSRTVFLYELTGAGRNTAPQPPDHNSYCDNYGTCTVPWANGTRSVSSVILIADGLCFTFLAILFLGFGSAADYGSLGHWLVVALTVITWAAQFGFVGVTIVPNWSAAMAIYIVSYVGYRSTVIFFSAIFPRLARSMPHVRKAQEDLSQGNISQEEHDRIQSLEKNHVSLLAAAHTNLGSLAVFILFWIAHIPDPQNTNAESWTLLSSTGWWVAFGVWWFVHRQRRPNPRLPTASSYVTVGSKQVALALRNIRLLPQTFMYLIAFFLLSTGLNTTSILVRVIPNGVTTYNFLGKIVPIIIQIVTSIIGTIASYYLQREFGTTTKQMFMVTSIFAVIIAFYGMLGIWISGVGYHNDWESYMYSAVFGIFQAPYFAYSRTMLSELTPVGHENLFFSLFGFADCAASFIGVVVMQAIIDHTQSEWKVFPFTFAVALVATILFHFVNVEKGRADCRKLAKELQVTKTE